MKAFYSFHMYPGTKYAHDVNFDNKIILGALLWNPTLDCYEQHTKTLYKTLTCKNHKNTSWRII